MNQQSFFYSPFYESRSDLDTIDPHVEMHNVFLQAELYGRALGRSWSGLNLVLGARLFTHTYFDTKYTVEINPTFKLNEEALLSFSYCQGYNVPSLYQLFAPETYIPWDGGNATGLTRGNKNLQPEESSTYELGIRYNVSERIGFSFFLFQSRTENIIEYAYLWDGDIPIDSLGSDINNRDDYRGDRYLNAGTLISNGVEIAMSARLHGKLVMRVNVTLSGGRSEFSPDALDSSQTGGQHVQLFNSGVFLQGNTTQEGLVRRPSTANLSLAYAPNAKLLLSGLFQYTGLRNDVFYDGSLGPYGAQNTKSIGDYSVTTLEASYSITSHLDATLRIENVFDKDYEEIYGFSTRGRGGYLKLSFRW